jgi:hypothetical protein
MIERKIRDIFAKEYISTADVRRANTLLRIWKLKNNWVEDTRNPIKAL